MPLYSIVLFCYESTMLCFEVALSVAIILLPSVSDHYLPMFSILLQLLSGKQLQLLDNCMVAPTESKMMYYEADSMNCCSVLS